ncbi:MAG TPA: hypothetical protein ENN41_03300 [Sediminispirochaeta sp.]|nr:hypothetical protein [Sediminispirochaeta sp.]
MKYQRSKRRLFVNFILLGALAGTLFWELAERLFSYLGIFFNLGLGPVGFDLHVLALGLVLNPGTILGAAGSFFILRRL